MRGDKSLAYDLVARQGRVSSRVALLLRSAERQPWPPRFFERERLRFSPIERFGPRYMRAFEGELLPAWALDEERFRT